MSRLTTPKTERNREMICRYEDCDVCEEYCPHLNEDNCQCLQEVLSKLADYEDKEEQGLLIELPVPIRTTVYIIEDDCGGDICDCGGDCGNCASHRKYVDEIEFDYCLIHAWGKWVFATEDEAEEALAKMGGKQ